MMSTRSCAWVGFVCSLAIACGAESSRGISDQTSRNEPEVTKTNPGNDAGSNPTSDTPIQESPKADGDAGTNTPPPKKPDGKGDDENGGNDNGGDDKGGVSRRSASGHDCCYGGQYLRCPDTVACFGGFDVNECVRDCNGDFSCSIACTQKLGSAPPPTTSCTKTQAPPNVQCTE